MAFASSAVANGIFFSAKNNKPFVSYAIANDHNAKRTTAKQLPVQHVNKKAMSSSILKLPSSISNLLHLHLSAHQEVVYPPRTTNSCFPIQNEIPSCSPKDDISSLQPALHGRNDWSPVLEPLHPYVRRELIKYGELAQATYDAFDNNPLSKYQGSCLYCRNRLLPALGLSHHGYFVTKYIYATTHAHLLHWLVRPFFPSRWSDDSNWMGFIAVSGDEESRRIGCRDIAVAWRGTVSPAEWIEDLQGKLEHLPQAPDDVRVEHGFLSMYTSRSPTSRFTRSSASEQVMPELLRLVELYKKRGEEVSVTITGHSLGGALALLNAAEAGSLLPKDVAVKAISFGAPRVGNEEFGDMLRRDGVKVLRVVTKQDVVPKVPGLFFNEGLNRTGWEWIYEHVGEELELDARASPYLKNGVVDIAGFHGLETYLHLVDGYDRAEGGFRAGARRDVALVNKASGFLREELSIPANWYQPENKGMVRNKFGRWVLSGRDPEDIPSPCTANAYDVSSSVM
ncbi:hypothetical protein HPP92_019505 [Vanilla planifolia]|uniref:Fungal lipase-type domain-containing protein n=1 Tax=Vanilla planifolia TaxID=51239 RepID=A0A835UL68_VANPL|nr:hypothetical protein HPP92_019505 [Vanilla planifolia]